MMVVTKYIYIYHRSMVTVTMWTVELLGSLIFLNYLSYLIISIVLEFTSQQRLL